MSNQEIKEFLSNHLEPTPSREQLEILHRQRFGLALLGCASFVLLLSFVFPAVDRVWWICGGLLVLAAGGYQFDRATRALRRPKR